MYGIGYRQRYGAQAVEQNQFGYAGYDGCGCGGGVGENAGPVAAGGGYGTAIVLGSGTAAVGYGAPAGIVDKRRKPFWNTVGDVAKIGAMVALGAGVIIATGGAGIAVTPALVAGAMAPAGLTALSAVQRGVQTRKWATASQVLMERKRNWKLRAQTRRGRVQQLRDQLRAVTSGQIDPVGQGNIGTAAAEGYYDVAADPGQPDVSTAVPGGISPMMVFAGLLVLGGGAWFLTRGSKSRRVA